MNNLERNSTVYYELFSTKFGVLVIQEPKGWSNDTESFTRDADSRGILSKIDIDLEFFGNGAEYLKDVYTVLGTDEKVLLTKYEKNRFSLSEQWEIRYIQELDLGTYKRNSRTGNVTVNSVEGGLFSDIKNRESDEYNLLDNLSADEIDIGNLKTSIFQPRGRGIFLESKLESTAIGYRINSRERSGASPSTVGTSRTIPMELVYNSNVEDISTPSWGVPAANELPKHSSSNDIGESVESNQLFFFEAEQANTIKLKIQLTYKIVDIIKGVSTTPKNFKVDIYKVKRDGASDNLYDKTSIQDFDIVSNVGVEKTINQEFTIELNKGDSLGVVFYTEMDFGGNVFNPLKKGFMDVYLNVLESIITVQDITTYTQNITVSKCIKPLDLFDRLVAKITGKKGLVRSSIFEQQADGTPGEYEFMVIDNGLWARGFPDSYKGSSDEEQKIQLTTSFKDAFESFNYLEPLCWFTEIVGNKEYVRIETARHTQQNFIGIKLDVVNDINEEGSKIDVFSNIKIGHEKSLEYEEVSGLDEPNGQSEFTTFIKRNNSEYTALSGFRVDAVGYEITRRLPFTLFPKKDAKRDDDIWMHDAELIEGTDIITHKTWQKRFDTQPVGIYDPDSAWNLWLSPMNRLFYGHGYSVKRGLYHFPDKSIKFNSSNANQNLITQNAGTILSESGSILIKDIAPARVEATKIDFTFKMTQALEDKFKGKTLIGGVETPNYFGLIQYKEKGKNAYGRLVSLESSDEAKITLIKARF